MTKIWGLAAIATVVAGVFACSGTSSGGSPSYSATNCPSVGINASSACSSCLSSSCGNQISAVNQSCSSSVLSCACPSGANASNCNAPSACQSAGLALESCASSCASACAAQSSSSGGGGSSSGGPNACLQGAVGSGCYACTQNNCGSQLSNFESSCTAYINCVCAGGSFNACNETSCQSQITAACTTAAQAVNCAACSSQCQGGPTCTGGSSSGGSSGGSGSSSGGTSTCSQPAACGSSGKTLSFCDSGSVCSYVVSGTTITCASCSSSDLQTCAQNAATACQ